MYLTYGSLKKGDRKMSVLRIISFTIGESQTQQFACSVDRRPIEINDLPEKVRRAIEQLEEGLNWPVLIIFHRKPLVNRGATKISIGVTSVASTRLRTIEGLTNSGVKHYTLRVIKNYLQGFDPQ